MNNRKIFLPLSLLFAISLFSCQENGKAYSPNKKTVDPDNIRPAEVVSSDTSGLNHAYVATGFYFLAAGDSGIKMRKDFSNKIYTLADKPFIGVNNIKYARVQKNKDEQGVYSFLNMVLDDQGTRKFKEVTGNPAYPFIAIVIANRLLYVVENKANITTGIMNIIVNEYSEKELKELLVAISRKL
jgi:preprotein translocase subunit SecD